MLRFALTLVYTVLLLVGLAVGSGTATDIDAAVYKAKYEVCQKHLDEWQKWGDQNVSRCEKAIADYSRIESDNADLRGQNDHLEEIAGGNAPKIRQVFAAFWGIGVGVAMVILLIKGLKRLGRLGSINKQLLTLIAGAMWVSVTALIQASDYTLSRHPVNMLFTVLVYSLPAFLFAGIGFWWFGKTKQLEPTP